MCIYVSLHISQSNYHFSAGKYVHANIMYMCTDMICLHFLNFFLRCVTGSYFYEKNYRSISVVGKEEIPCNNSSVKCWLGSAYKLAGVGFPTIPNKEFPGCQLVLIYHFKEKN
jgi:hypothetical protein